MISDLISDVEFFNENGFFQKDDYKLFVKKLNRLSEGIRVPLIRKGLDFQPIDYDDYVEGLRGNQKSDSLEDPFPYASMLYETELLSSFFPDFEQEYFTRGEYIILNQGETEIEVNSFVPLDKTQYRTLTVASHQIESAISLLAKEKNVLKTLYLEPTTSWFFQPNRIGASVHNIKVQLSINIMD